MAGNSNSASSFFSSIGKSFNLLREWRESKETQDSFFHQANSILKENADNIRQSERQNNEERGKDISNAGASEIDVSSFNDALLAKDLKNIREEYNKRAQANAEARNLRKKAGKEREKRRDKAFSYSINLLSDLSKLGF